MERATLLNQSEETWGDDAATLAWTHIHDQKAKKTLSWLYDGRKGN